MRVCDRCLNRVESRLECYFKDPSGTVCPDVSTFADLCSTCTAELSTMVKNYLKDEAPVAGSDFAPAKAPPPAPVPPAQTPLSLARAILLRLDDRWRVTTLSNLAGNRSCYCLLCGRDIVDWSGLCKEHADDCPIVLMRKLIALLDKPGSEPPQETP